MARQASSRTPIAGAKATGYRRCVKDCATASTCVNLMALSNSKNATGNAVMMRPMVAVEGADVRELDLVMVSAVIGVSPVRVWGHRQAGSRPAERSPLPSRRTRRSQIDMGTSSTQAIIIAVLEGAAALVVWEACVALVARRRPVPLIFFAIGVIVA